MNINDKIEEIVAQLAWEVVNIYREAGDHEIVSDPSARRHTIYIPLQDYRAIEQLHELAHAVLAERHHLLATAIFERGVADEILFALTCPVRTASDWFADDLLMQWAPDAEKAEISEHFGYALEASNEAEADPLLFYGGGLMAAQAVRYLGVKLNRVPPVYRPVVEGLMTIKPRAPSLEAKAGLINRLAALTWPYRVELINDNGLDVWRVRKEE